MKANTLAAASLILLVVNSFAQTESKPPAASLSNPNIIFINADDMGVGDVSHTTGLAPTPHIDRMAAEGMRFTDAHTSSSVCTPSRYSLITGRYNWRTRLTAHVFSKPGEAPADFPDIQLFNLAEDIGETNNLQAQYPERVAALLETLKGYVAEGRSTEGEPQQNATEVNIYALPEKM